MQGESPDLPRAPSSRVPFPDPTERTREDLLREIKAVRELMETKMETLANINLEKITALQAAVPDVYRYYDRLLVERDQRYHERATAAEDAVKTAFISSEQAITAAFEAAEKAISKAEVSIEKRADATYVALNELQRMLSNLMPRVEGDQRFKTVEDRTAELSSRVDRIEAVKVGSVEAKQTMSDSVKLGISAIGAILLLIGFAIAQRGV